MQSLKGWWMEPPAARWQYFLTLPETLVALAACTLFSDALPLAVGRGRRIIYGSFLKWRATPTPKLDNLSIETY